MKKALCLFLFLIALVLPGFANDLVGFWKSIDEETNLPTTITGIYEYRGKLYGRIVITFDEGIMKDTIYKPGDKAELIQGDPYYAGLDFIWDLVPRGSKWINGNIMDPKEGKVYLSEIWLDNGKLIVRGKIKIGFISIGRNQTWLPVTSADLPAGFVLPDLSTFQPTIRMPK